MNESSHRSQSVNQRYSQESKRSSHINLSKSNQSQNENLKRIKKIFSQGQLPTNYWPSKVKITKKISQNKEDFYVPSALQDCKISTPKSEFTSRQSKRRSHYQLSLNSERFAELSKTQANLKQDKIAQEQQQALKANLSQQDLKSKQNEKQDNDENINTEMSQINEVPDKEDNQDKNQQNEEKPECILHQIILPEVFHLTGRCYCDFCTCGQHTCPSVSRGIYSNRIFKTQYQKQVQNSNLLKQVYPSLKVQNEWNLRVSLPVDLKTTNQLCYTNPQQSPQIPSLQNQMERIREKFVASSSYQKEFKD